MSEAVKFPQRGKIRGRLQEEVIVHGVKRDAGLRLYEVEHLDDGERTMWLTSAVDLLGPVEESTS